MDRVSNSAFNFWSINPRLMQVKDTINIFGPFSYKILGFIIVIILYLIIISRYLRNAKNIVAFLYSIF